MSAWSTKYPGIFEKENKLFCKPCVDYPQLSDPSSTLVTGNTSYRVGGLDKHWTSNPHLRAANQVLVEARRAAQEPVDGPMDTMMRKLNEQNKDILIKLFNTVYFILKYEEPFSALPRQLALQIKNGSSLSRLSSYKSDQACRRLAQHISDEIREPIARALREATVISVMFDGATDKSTEEVEVVYVRYLKDGEPQTRYLSLQPLQHAHAQGVYDAINNAFKHHGIEDWQNKVVGIGCDGANVNIGKKNSVASRILEVNGETVVVHCVAHRLELGILNAIKEENNLQTVKSVLQMIYKHYHYSPKAVREIKEIADALDEKFLKPNKVDGTRWTPHMKRALEVLTSSYQILYTHFEHVSQSKPGETTAEVRGRAVFLANKLKDFRILHFIHFMLDLLDVIARLSLEFQKDNLTVSSMLDALEVAQLELTALTLKPGEHLQKFTDAIENKSYKGTILKNHSEEKELYSNVIQNVQDHLSSRLEPEKDKVLKAARVFEPSQWPQDRADLARYGDDQINLLLDQFANLLERKNIEPDEIRTQWIQLKAYIRNLGNHGRIAMCYFNGMKERFSSILSLYEIATVIPCSSAICERGFSCLKRIKQDWRCSLAVEQVDRLMLVSLEGPSFEDYEAERALNRWWTAGQRARRPQFNSGDKDVDDDDDLINYFLQQNDH